MNLNFKLFDNTIVFTFINFIWVISSELIISNIIEYEYADQAENYALLFAISFFAIWINFCTFADAIINTYLEAKELEKEQDKE